MRRAPRGRVLDAAHPHVEVAALDRLIDLVERDLHELRAAAESPRDFLRHFDVEAAKLRRIARIRLHERRPTLGITAPVQHRQRRGDHHQCDQHRAFILQSKQ